MKQHLHPEWCIYSFSEQTLHPPLLASWCLAAYCSWMSAKQIGTTDPVQQSVINKQKGKVCITCSPFLLSLSAWLQAAFAFRGQEDAETHSSALKTIPILSNTTFKTPISSFLGPLLEVYLISGEGIIHWQATHSRRALGRRGLCCSGQLTKASEYIHAFAASNMSHCSQSSRNSLYSPLLIFLLGGFC